MLKAGNGTKIWGGIKMGYKKYLKLVKNVG